MILYLVRHGKAKQSSPTGRDADRPLKLRGERQSAWLGEYLQQADSPPAPELILASGHVRAAETARIIQEATGGELRHESALELGWPAEDVISLISDEISEGNAGPIMLVGHNPQMEILVSLLAEDISEYDFEMRTGMAAVIEIDPAKGLRRKGRLIATLRHND